LCIKQSESPSWTLNLQLCMQLIKCKITNWRCSPFAGLQFKKRLTLILLYIFSYTFSHSPLTRIKCMQRPLNLWSRRKSGLQTCRCDLCLSGLHMSQIEAASLWDSVLHWPTSIAIRLLTVTCKYLDPRGSSLVTFVQCNPEISLILIFNTLVF
jgi:hypothetical protein